jgi:hypothetical protein
MIKPLDENLEAILELKSGILAGNMRESPAEQELVLRDRATHEQSKRNFGSLDPILASELLRDIATL